ncbi:MAG: AAA family ATPase [Chlorobium sp.]
MEHYNFYKNRAEENKSFEPDEQKTSPFKLSPDEQFPMLKRAEDCQSRGTIIRGKEYKPSEPLQHAVNVALMLHKPLLLTGEPGTGKSDLAYHLAWHFGWGEVEHFVTRTDSVATDLLYRYDTLAHFHKVNIQKECSSELTAAEIEKMFISYVALGRAICDSSGDNVEKVSRRRVVLIDEIDKAPRDLPNDILTILEEMRFEVPQLKTGNGKEKPIYKKTGNDELKPVVILTSNSEKTLPEAFLRRCVFFHIEMPEQKELMDILLLKKSILPDIKQEGGEFIKLFFTIRDLVKGKKPATHELILWIWWMRKHGFTPADIYHYDEHAATAKILLSGISVLAKEDVDLTNVTKAITSNTLKE